VVWNDDQYRVSTFLTHTTSSLSLIPPSYRHSQTISLSFRPSASFHRHYLRNSEAQIATKLLAFRIAQSVLRFAKGWMVRGSKRSRGRFFAPVQTCLGAQPSLLYCGYLFPFVGGGWRWPPTPSSTEVKERVGLIPCWAFMSCSRETFTFTYLPWVLVHMYQQLDEHLAFLIRGEESCFLPWTRKQYLSSEHQFVSDYTASHRRQRSSS
jgi:hypothetical protein